jgi:hypothetical protein
MKLKSGQGFASRVRARRAGRTPPKRVVYVGSYEDRLSRIPAMHVSADDDGRTTEDVRRQKAEGRGLYGGGPPSRLAD